MDETAAHSNQSDDPAGGEVAAALGVLTLCILARLPFWFASVIAWDESTYILMGQELLDGHLPYVRLWENKPPLAFVPFALALAIYPSIVSVRVLGAVCVAITGYLTYRFAYRLADRRAGVLAAALCVLLIGNVRSGQSTLTETVALPPLMGALVLLPLHRVTPTTSFLSGFFLSVAVLIRTNLAYTAIAASLGLAAMLRRDGVRGGMRELGWFASGALLPPIAITLIFWWHGHIDTLYAATVAAPLQYAMRRGPHVLFASHLTYQPWLVMASIAAVVAVYRLWTTRSHRDRRSIEYLGLFSLGTAASVVGSGAPHPHYLIQIVPFTVIPLAVGWAVTRSRAFHLAGTAAVAVVLVVVAMPVVQKYQSLARLVQRGSPVTDDPGYRIANYLNAANPDRAPIYLMSNHIAYWLTGTLPPTRVSTHPSNITKPSIVHAASGPKATAVGELEKVFATEPRFVVKRAELWYLDRHPEARALLDHRLDEDYELATLIGDCEIYSRRVAKR